MNQKRGFWVLGLLTLTLLGGLSLRLCNWADQPAETPSDKKSESLVSSSDYAPVIRDADLVRVGISNNSMVELEYSYATITGTAPFQVMDKATGNIIMASPANQIIRISRNRHGFWLDFASSGGQLGPLGNFQVKSVTTEGRLKVASVTRKGIVPSYRGIFEVVSGYSGVNKFTIVNVLPMQDYLKAVVPNELPYSYGFEAVKAQAVAARNYAIHPREKPWPQFDICDSQYCQAYYGANTEHPQTTRALAETHGLVALYNGEPILALYSSSHGGYSENYENAFSDPKTNRFPATPIPYLRGGSDRGLAKNLSDEKEALAFYSDKNADSFDILSPNYRWQKRWSRQTMEALLNRNLSEASRSTLTSPFIKPFFSGKSSIGRLRKLKVLERGVSGKIMRLAVEGTNGTWVLEKEFVIRKVLTHGGRFLPSANLVFQNLTDKSGNLVAVNAIGGGFGHGVGMSQLGASYLSKHGKSFAEILQHYYKGIAIGTIPVVARSGEGMKTEFFVPESQGYLHLISNPNEPVRLSINNSEVVLTADSTGKSIVSVASYLKSGMLNELRIYPLEETSSSVAKAWIELHESKPKTEASTLEPGNRQD